ncbi:formyl transferase [Rhizobium sp. Root274]|uniref:formyl transferase n=1 Tax=unclassified Rhizobium TaxID=2613769 RepID=UPI00071255F1|nr:MULTISPECIES: formyl transferase [unclassified Rhizobium]KQW26975.1 formyl transferase [Rhizobium sp. Root1240]KRD27963.1 formyl transferase [Rhizobium sp. Root274]
MSQITDGTYPVSGRPILLMTAGGLNPTLVAADLARRGFNIHVVLEQPEGKAEITRRRARKLGWMAALGQLGTMIAARLLRRLANRRVAALLAAHGFDKTLPETVPIHPVTSINAQETTALVAELSPAAILLVSTRLMSSRQLAAMPCPVINLHAGINPTYRGQMGGYWSLRENDPQNFGATLHLVDAGTDTGGTLYEVRTSPSKGDFIATYPLVLTLAALDITARSIDDAVNGTLRPIPPTGPSALRFPPTLWSWIWHGIVSRIW